MNSAPWVTIGIPTYNRAATYLRPCLESALLQTYSDIEIIVADNGSTDDTQAVVRGYRDPRIRYFRQPVNIVPNENFNFCLRQARGTYFLLLLDDEFIDTDFVQYCLGATAGCSDFGLIRTGFRTVNAQGATIEQRLNLNDKPLLTNLFLSWVAGRTALYLCNTLFNRAALMEIGGFQSRHNLFQDVIAQVKIAARMPWVDIAPVMAATRRHRGQFTHYAKVQSWCEDSLELLNLMCEVAEDQKPRVRDLGEKFFANICYHRANAIRSPIERARAYATVYSMFDRRHTLPWRMAWTSTAAYRSLRDLKRWLLHLPAWAD
ncbi:MAG: glycosyltransferase [Gammaproteobacteria bacterium]|nr:glycosyltransferase [Gammaproteobacteria bacterium]